MDSDSWIRVKRIVDAYHEEQPDDRDAWLAERCDGDEELRAEVESLLDADAAGRLSDDDRALERIGIEHTGDGPTLSDLHPALGASSTGPDDRIGPYRLREEIGVGGTSVVYRAERAGAPFEQTVAVKVLQRRLHADDAERRFRAEQQVLASLDHSNIAQLIDGGVTEGGRPYLVMEYVDGTPLTDYVRAHELSLDERLDLLVQVMEAVRAAHENLVVHRDLKPSNVLVEQTDAGPTVKLLDFGIAKLLDDALPVTRPQTQTGHRLLTPAYAAPEQLVGDADVSTRTDVYQLGALAYEVLAGDTPFDLEAKSLTEIEAVVMEKSPPAPSARTTGPSVSPARLQGDLDTILQKALRKEPERRYRSVEAFLEDLRRYRAGKPVRAQPATLGYRTQKFLSRNATGFVVTTLFVLLAVGFTAFHIDRISEQRDRARREARKAEQISAYLTDLLQSTRPDESGGDTVTAEDMLRRGRRRIGRLDDQPAVQARMLQLLGNAYRERGAVEKAAGLLRRSLFLRDSLYDGSHRSLANTMEELAHLHREQGRYERADSLFRAALSIQRDLFGPASPKLWEPLNNLGVVAKKEGRYAAADSFYRKALAAARAPAVPDTSTLTNTLQNRAVLAHTRGRLAQADSLYRRALALGRRAYEVPHPLLATMLANLGRLRMARGAYAEADSLHRRALAMRTAIYDAPHVDIATTLDGLAVLHLRRGRLEAADSLFQEAVAMKRRALGPRHPETGLSMMNRATVLRKRGQTTEAVPRYRTARAIFRDAFSETHVRTVHANARLGQALAELDRYAAAERPLKQALDAYRQNGLTDRMRTTRADLANLYAEWGRPEKAAAYQDTTAASVE